jgi:predicted transcriptional regulator
MSFEELDYMTPIQVEIFKELSKGISLTRDDFVEMLDRARTTIYDNLEKLETRKLIRRFKRGNGLRGRPLTFWYIPRNLLHELFKKIREDNNNGS